MRNRKITPLKRRRLRIRQKVNGTAQRPRLSFHRSERHLYAQAVDDRLGETLVFITTNTKAMKNEGKSFGNMPAAEKLGAEFAQRAKAKGISRVVFDRGGRKYHGIVKAFADAARKGGLEF